MNSPHWSCYLWRVVQWKEVQSTLAFCPWPLVPQGTAHRLCSKVLALPHEIKGAITWHPLHRALRYKMRQSQQIDLQLLFFQHCNNQLDKVLLMRGKYAFIYASLQHLICYFWDQTAIMDRHCYIIKNMQFLFRFATFFQKYAFNYKYFFQDIPQQKRMIVDEALNFLNNYYLPGNYSVSNHDKYQTKKWGVNCCTE